MKENKLKSLFSDLQDKMISDFNVNKSIKHTVTKGNFTERNWINWLNKYLPKRYKTDNAFIIDFNSKISDQIDLVIYDQQYSPFVLNQNGIKYIPAESVYAIFEIKQEFNKKHFDYSVKKIKSVRLLERTNAHITHAQGKLTEPKKPFEIIGGIITLNYTLKSNFTDTFKSYNKGLNENERINLGCILNSLSFINDFENNDLKISNKEESLIFFFFKLFSALQNLGTVPAMEMDKWGQVLDSY